MFDTMKVAKKIREARMARNMTQMNLADAMGVSYQAVSNWERGNSMPDIAKLEDLCRVLGISITELLGTESRETAAVHKLMQDPEPELTMEELSEIAPMLPPETMKEQAKRSNGKKKNIKALGSIAMFLDEELLEELLEDVEVDSLSDLIPLAPFLDEELLDKLVRQAPVKDMGGVIALAPFLGEDTLKALVHRGEKGLDANLLVGLAPFLDEDTLDEIVLDVDSADESTVYALAPFLGEETLDAVAEKLVKQGKAGRLTGLYPFLSQKTIRKIAKAMLEEGDIEGLKDTAVFL